MDRYCYGGLTGNDNNSRLTIEVVVELSWSRL
jgi:hypothetical protein